MEYRGSSVYDQEDFQLKYMNRRSRKDSPNNAIEKPIIYELIRDIQHKHILDLGCGDAAFGKELLGQGADSYLGVEGSRLMAEKARLNLGKGNGAIHQITMESYDYPAETFDIVTSRFAIHYVSDIQLLFRKIHKSLKEEGRFVFSVQHPLITSSFKSKQTDNKRGDWIVDDYFHEGERKEPWIGETVVKFHRTIEHYFKALVACGFSVADLREGMPKRDYFSSDEEFTRRKRIPVVLVFSAEKSIN